MKLLLVISLLYINQVSAQECELSVNKTESKLTWESQNGMNKFLFIKNLDTNLLYPQMITTSTSGTLSLKLLEPNSKGYQVVLASITDNTKNAIDALLIDCSKKKNCSVNPKDVKVKKEKCSVLKSNIIK